jgi:hypothetical protein
MCKRQLYLQQGQKLIDYLEREFSHDLPHVIKAVHEARA